MRQYRGNIHIHSTHSDGTGSVEDIIAAGQRAGLDYLIITDHNTLAARAMQGWHGKTLVMVGSEIGTRVRDHYLAIDAKEGSVGESKGISTVRADASLAFKAHPYIDDSPVLGAGHALRDAEWHPKKFTGIELWNYCTDWKGSIASALHAAHYTLFPDAALRGPDKRLLRDWDRWTQEHRVVAIGGSDAHAKKRRVFGMGFTYFPYEMLFRRVNTHILAPAFSGKAEQDIASVHDALRAGHCFVANDHEAPAEGFEFMAHNGLDEAVMGDDILRWDWVRVKAKLPSLGILRAIQNGTVIKEVEGHSIDMKVEQDGPVRIEALKSGKPWIFSNPIYVR